MNLKTFFTYSFDKWWRPVLYLVFATLLLGLCLCINETLSAIIGLVFFLIAYLALIFSFFYQLYKRRWLNSILTFFVLGATIVIGVFLIFTFLFLDMEMPDTFANNLKIPTNIQIDMPVDMSQADEKPDSISNIKKTKIDFQLYNSFQPGLYEYDFWCPKIDSGLIYLKAFEITHNYGLSEDRLSERSAVQIKNPTDSILKFSSDGLFTIYEGDWGKPYAARFEVWFKPASGNVERKLFEKNYQIEGWQR